MTPASSLTERYLAAALRGVPDRQRDDVARELRSSVADAIEDRVTAGEDPLAAEKSVLEGLGDPARFAAGLTGRPLYLIGPDLFVEYRQLLRLLLGIVVPIVGVVAAAVDLSQGGDWVSALVDGIVGALTVALHICFWVTLTFALIERADSAREARLEISKAAGRWTVDMLPAPAATRIGAGEVVGEVLTDPSDHRCAVPAPGLRDPRHGRGAGSVARSGHLAADHPGAYRASGVDRRGPGRRISHRTMDDAAGHCLRGARGRLRRTDHLPGPHRPDHQPGVRRRDRLAAARRRRPAW